MSNEPFPLRRRALVSSRHERDVLHSLRLTAQSRRISVSTVVAIAVAEYLERQDNLDHGR